MAMLHNTFSTIPSRKLKVWNSNLFRTGFSPVLRVLLGAQLLEISKRISNLHIALYVRERGRLLLLISLDSVKPPSYCTCIPLTKVRQNIDSLKESISVGSNSTYLDSSTKYITQTITLRNRKELRGILLILKSNEMPDLDTQFSKINPLIRTITTLLSLITILLKERQRFSSLELINRISQKIDSLTDEDKVYNQLVQHIQSSFSYDHVAIYLLDKESKILQMKALAGKYLNVVPKDQIVPINKGIVGRVATSGKTLLSNEARRSPYFLNATPEQIPTEAELCVPIRVDGETIGVLNIEHCELLYFDQEDISSIELLADRIGVAIKNARLNSELKELETLKRGLLQAQQLASIGELASNIVHEVRNPMNAITQAMDILAADLVLNEEKDQLMNVLKEEFARLNDTLNTYHLLAYKKEERQFKEGNLKSVIEKVVRLLRADQSIAQRIRFKILIDNLLVLRFDSKSIKQVFWNLLLNAVDSIKGEGEIIFVSKRENSNIFISIEDNGSGIKDDQLLKIFEPFYTTKEQGAGLGLTIVRRIIEDHGWKITSENIIPHGTRFTILISDI